MHLYSTGGSPELIKNKKWKINFSETLPKRTFPRGKVSPDSLERSGCGVRHSGFPGFHGILVLRDNLNVAYIDAFIYEALLRGRGYPPEPQYHNRTIIGNV